MFTFSVYKFGCLTDIRHNYSVKLSVSYVKMKCMYAIVFLLAFWAEPPES